MEKSEMDQTLEKALQLIRFSPTVELTMQSWLAPVREEVDKAYAHLIGSIIYEAYVWGETPRIEEGPLFKAFVDGYEFCVAYPKVRLCVRRALGERLFEIVSIDLLH